MRAGYAPEDDALRIPTKIPGIVRQGGAAGCFGFGASGSLWTFWGMDFGHFLVNHRQKSKSAPPVRPQCRCRAFWERGGIKVGKALPETGPLPHLFWASTLDSAQCWNEHFFALSFLTWVVAPLSFRSLRVRRHS